MPESLSQQRISDQYTSLLHISGGSIASWDRREAGDHPAGVAKVYDGAGNVTGISLSSADNRFIINNYAEPIGWSYQKEWLDAFFPINVIIMTTNFENPGTRIMGTKWVLESEGLFAVGAGTSTDKNDDSFTFTAGNNKQRDGNNLQQGDIAGEYRAEIKLEDLPNHTHTTDTRTEIVPAGKEGEGTNVGFIHYFGDTINPQQLTGDDARYLDSDAIVAFQNNTEFDDQLNYRDYLIKRNHELGKTYTDADFDPQYSNQSLRGWAQPSAGGPGWGGMLNTTGKFIGNSPRPIGVRWTFQGTEYFIARPIFDPRTQSRVHPGRFTDADLLKARDFIIGVLGVKEAQKALAGVNRLIELNELPEQARFGENLYYGLVPGSRVVESTTTGQCIGHNNIPPNYPVYFWRRVPLDFVENIPPAERPRPSLPFELIIDRNQISTKNNVFNLNQWAVDNGWNGQAACRIIIDNGVYIYSDDPNNDKVPAMVIDDFPGGLTLINKGFIMGRGGDGGSYYTDGQNGGDAIHVIGNSEITIDNTAGGIGGGGGGGSASKLGNSGGGGGAGGGWGGTASIFQLPGWDYGDGDGRVITTSEVEYSLRNPHYRQFLLVDLDGKPYFPTAAGGTGGAPGQPGGHGRWYNGFVSKYSFQLFKARGDIVTVGWGPAVVLLPGVGGEAGGSGAGGKATSRGVHDQGSGGGGGRILTSTASGGGTGGIPGARFGAIDADGNVRTDGPEWSNTAPANNGSVNVQVIPRPGRSRDKEIETYVTAYNSSQPYKGWNSGYKLRSPFGYGNGAHWAVGPHWRANGVNGGTTGLPYIVAGVNKAGRGSHTEFGETRTLNYNGFSYLSPTGWDGYNHRSGLIHGGSTNQPGIYKPANARRVIGNQDLSSGVYTENTAAGGGGWGAPGGVPFSSRWREMMDHHYDFVGTGPMIRKAGDGGLTVKAMAGKVTIVGGLVYGETQGNVNITQDSRALQTVSSSNISPAPGAITY